MELAERIAPIHEAGRWPALEKRAHEPRPLAWAGMKDAVGVNTWAIGSMLDAMGFCGVSDRILPRVEQAVWCKPLKDVGDAQPVGRGPG
jgi:hypothetical protein